MCGCGIEIDGPNIRINFWLNGHFLGTVFEHNCAIGSKLWNMLSNGCDASYFPGVSLKVNGIVTLHSDGPNIRINFWLNGHFLGTVFEHNCAIRSKLCNMLSNGCDASYFPGVSLKVNDIVTLNSCEFIFSLEDMLECPLPLGYKPFVDTELDNDQDNIYKVRSNRSTIFLCDFVDSQHLETEFRFENQQLVLQHDKNGLLLTIDHCESWTISFDFQLLDKFDNHYFILLTFDDTLETFSIRIPTSKIYNEIRIGIVYYSNKREIKIYIDNDYQLVECPSMISYKIYILPLIVAGLENVAI
ncbi:unnamed protein product [Rotaria sp. Silwood2]|nr:unnamed protein product [Rotaria sp. Silwood2]